MSDARHLLTVWNPSYAEDALDAHLRVLLRWTVVLEPDEATKTVLVITVFRT